MPDPHLTDPQAHKAFSFSDIPGWIHAIWITVVGLVWKGKPAVKAIYGVATVDARLTDVEDRLLKVEQSQVTKQDIDNMRGELNGVLQANQISTLNAIQATQKANLDEIRFLFTGQEERIMKKYEPLDSIINKLEKKVGP